MTLGAFPFGTTVRACTPLADGPRRVFVLGAYPSALHVSWQGPPDSAGKRPRIRALPVANEPEPFWTGGDEKTEVEKWKAEVFDGRFGSAEAAGPQCNGSSGRSLDDDYLRPLDVHRSDAWITDCLDTYRMSTGVAKALHERFEPFAAEVGIPLPHLAPHPSERAIANEALDRHGGRLLQELATAQASLIVTLGNAARRVLSELTQTPITTPGLTLTRYGGPTTTSSGATWFALAHPGVLSKNAAWSGAHRDWRNRVERSPHA